MAAEFENIPSLEGWVNLTEAAEMLGITRQHAHKKARLTNEGKPNGWKTIHRVGSKPMYVVSIREVKGMLALAGNRDERITTDLMAGTLTPEDREAWLANHRMKAEEWTDHDILVAIGSGIA